MSDLLAVILIVGLGTERTFAEWLHARERRYLINATLADTPAELIHLETAVDTPRQPKAKVGDLDGFEGPVGI